MSDLVEYMVKVPEEYQLWLDSLMLSDTKFREKLRSVVKDDLQYVTETSGNTLTLKEESGKVVYTAVWDLIGIYYKQTELLTWVWAWGLELPEMPEELAKLKAKIATSEVGYLPDRMTFEDPKMLQYLMAVAKQHGDFEVIQVREQDLTGATAVLGYRKVTWA